MKFGFIPIMVILPLQVFSQTVIVSLHPDGVETNEPSIAINPNNPAQQILGSNNCNFFFSNDGGFTWVPGFPNPPEGYYGDPVVYINKKGTFYLCHLAKNPMLKWPDHFDRIVFEKSHNGAKSFESVGIGLHPGKVQDKPWIYVDEKKRSKNRGNIYVSWTEFDRYASLRKEDSSRIMVAFSEDDGQSFSNPVVVSDSCGSAADDDATLEGATIAGDKKGKLVAAWAGKGKIWIDRSADGGKSWGKDEIIAEQIGGWNLDDENQLYRANSMPFLVSDKRGRMYLVFGDKRNGDQDVFYVYSKDRGKTWTSPIRINDDGMGNKKSQYMPHITVDPKTNRVYAVWYDRRNSEHNLYTDVYAAELRGKKVGKNRRITNNAFCVPGKHIFFGDYISIAAAKGIIRMAYTIYDQEKQMVTVQIAMAGAKGMRKGMHAAATPYLQLINHQDTAMVSIQFHLPESRSCTVELRRGEQIFYKQLFDPLPGADQEVLLPSSRFATGVYRLSLSSKGRKIEKDVFITHR